MEITKKQWTIIGVVIAVIAVWYFFLRKKKTESNWGGGIKTPAGTVTGKPLPGKFGRSSGGTIVRAPLIAGAYSCTMPNMVCSGPFYSSNGSAFCRCATPGVGTLVDAIKTA